MNKSSVIILVIAAIVFSGLGFVIGQVMAAGNNPGSADDPVVSQTYVDELVGVKVTALQNQIDEIMALLGEDGISTDTTDGTNDSNASSSGQKVTITADSVNVRNAPTDGDPITSVSQGTVLEYLGQTTSSDGVWYNVRLSGGSEGWIRSDLCTSPQ